MELTATIKQVLQPVSGVSKAGKAYTTHVVVVAYGEGQYEKELALTLMTKQVEKYGSYLRQGLQLKFYFDASSREYNGRYYTECVVWKIESLNAQQQPTAPIGAPPAYQQPTAPNYGPQYGQYQPAPQFGGPTSDKPW